MAIKSADQITIVDVTDAYSVLLTSEAYTFVGNTAGVPLMKQTILPVTVHLNIRLPLALLQPEPADAPTGPEPEAHACHSCGNCGGCGKCQHEEKQA